MNRLALDIETTGLNPAHDRVISAALHGVDGSVFVHDLEEKWVLWKLSDFDFRGGPIVTWNGDEFDLPFLAQRSWEHGIDLGLRLDRLGLQLGKYGRPLYRGTWRGVPCIDIAPWYQAYAERIGVKWSLKPVAEAVGLAPTIPDQLPSAMGVEELEEYNRSDARVTYELAVRGGA